jgi:NAD(P)-dependent dehydrogenase (short-subunit alcohol dehydrogenase family)
MHDFTGMVAVVTGAGSGIGRAVCERLAVDGARVAGLDLVEAKPLDGVEHLRADVTDQASVDEAIAAVIGRFGGLDIVVNNAGIGSVGTVADNDDEEWHRLYDVNVVGMVRVMRAALPHLRHSEHAAVVNTASICSWSGLPQRVCYSASKGAVYALTLAMAADHVADGIRVNCVCPGTADTPWVGRLLDAADDPPAARRALEQRQPMGRLGTAPEIAEAVAFLAAPTSTFVTGTALAVDGGVFGLRTPPRPPAGP